MEYASPTHIVPVKFCNQIRVWQLACDVTLLAYAVFFVYNIVSNAIRRSSPQLNGSVLRHHLSGPSSRRCWVWEIFYEKHFKISKLFYFFLVFK